MHQSKYKIAHKVAQGAVSLIGLMLAACMPVYEVDPSLPVAHLDTTGLSGPQICVDQKRYRLSVGSDGKSDIPAGETITLASAYQVSDGHTIYSCRPEISFLPSKDSNYVGVLLFKSKSCYLQVLKDDPDTTSGLNWETSAKRGTCEHPYGLGVNPEPER